MLKLVCLNDKNTLNQAQSTLNCQGKIVDLTSPQVMGIINITPDSFYTESRANDVTAAVKQAEKMLEEGAMFLDIGGMSSRPGAELISQEKEWQRIEKIVSSLRKEFPHCLLSIDTIHAETAKQAILSGANMINDISAGLFDNKMIETVAELGCPYIAMHMRGTPQTMKKQTAYENFIVEITDYFIERILEMRKAGIKDIILDPGFGFAKTIDQNFKLLANMHAFRFLEYPLLAGISRKSMIWKSLDISPEKSLNGTTALHMECLQQGARILRVHDVKEAVETITLFQALENNY